MSALNTAILDLLAADPGLEAKVIASRLHVPVHEVKNHLYGSLKGRLRQDNQCRWYVSSAQHPTQKTQLAEPGEAQKLCAYYLACLAHENTGEVGVFVPSDSYVELTTIPMLVDEPDSSLSSPEIQAFCRKGAQDGHKDAYFVGYPLLIRRFTSKKGNLVTRAEPLLLFRVDNTPQQGMHVAVHEPPQINYGALSELLRFLVIRGGNVPWALCR